MKTSYIILIILGIIFVLIIIFGLPRKKSIRRPNIEGLDNPDVARAFDKITNFLPFKILRKKVLNEIKKLEPKGRLIDAGCGSGNLIVEIAETFSYLELTGVDISLEILKFAKERAIKKGHIERIDFKEGTVESLPFPNESISFVVSSFSLHHWIDPIKAFQEFYRILDKDGIALLFDFRRDARKFFYGLFTFVTKFVVSETLKQINEPLGSIQSSYTPAEIKQLFIKNSFFNFKIKPFLAWMFILINK